MITVHVSPSAETVSIEHLVHGNITLSPEEAYSVLQRLKERESELHVLVAKRQLRAMSSKTHVLGPHSPESPDPVEVENTIAALLKELPANYPEAKLTKHPHGYVLQIGYTLIFNGVSAETAIKDTRHYVEARKNSPDLPIGVIYGIYD